MSQKNYVELGFACVDTGRLRRRGFPEVVFCAHKTPSEIERISRILVKSSCQGLLLTRLSISAYRQIKKKIKGLVYDSRARLAYLRPKIKPKLPGRVLVMTAGTSDIPVAQEAVLTLEFMGVDVVKLYDVGVAGVHRVMDKKDVLESAHVIIVIAGMEGALASLVSGLVRCPVVAVPTSCGYGAHFDGLAALLTMMNSCSPGVAVVNIDNGFGAGYFAGSMLKACSEHRHDKNTRHPAGE